MICGTAQGLMIKKTQARTPAKINYYRRRLREHVQGCKFCLRQYEKRTKRHLTLDVREKKF